MQRWMSRGFTGSCIGIVLATLLNTAIALDVPLTVRETAGVERLGHPVDSGAPLPRGAVANAEDLRLLDPAGQVVVASIVPRARWLEDRSLKWVTVHFVVPRLAADDALEYRLTLAPQRRRPDSPLRVAHGEDGRTVVVETGPARFAIPMETLAPFEQVHVRADPAEAFGEADALLRAPGTVRLVARNGASRLVPREKPRGHFRSEVAEIDDEPFTQTAAVDAVDIEERGPGRAVVALRGSFSTPDHPSLDYTARLYFYADSALARMTLSVRNRQTDDFARFVGIERLAVETPLRGSPASATVSLGAERTADGAAPLRLAQNAMDRSTLDSADAARLEGEQSAGWIRVAGTPGSLVAGTRWFWQTYPMGLTLSADGVVGLELKEASGERVDLYTGGAKTHFLFFHFERGAATSDPAAIAAAATDPLIAACAPDWYCQETRALGNLYSANLDLYAPRYRDLVARFQERTDGFVRRIVEARPRPGVDVDEYGWLDFGSGLHHPSYIRENAAESWWDGNYYDFPLAVLVNFLRTGDRLNLRVAEEAGLHLADLDICHSYPGHPAWVGSPRSGPVIGHFRHYTRSRGQRYMASPAFTFYKNESLYQLYYLTGERWYRDVARMSSDFAMARWGRGALRTLAHGLWGVLSAYRDTHEIAYLDRARFFVDEWGKPWQDRNQGSFQDQHWMYGLVFEAYDKYYRTTGDVETARYLVQALDALVAEFGRPDGGTGSLPGLKLFGFGLGYEHTGDERYRQQGLVHLEQLLAPQGEGWRVKTFAQNFRSSPYFLRYLTRDYRPPEPIVPTGNP